MKPNIVFLDAYSICGRDLSDIAALGDFTAYESTEPDEVLERCIDADVIIANKTVLDAEKLHKLPRLKLICVAATGMNNIDLKAAAELGIPVRNAVGYSTHSVSETTICSALALLREVVYYDRYFKCGDYSASPRMFNFDRPTGQIHGKNWGIIGLGNIGREVARLATAFGCNVRYTSTSGTARQEEYPQMPLEELLAWADVVSIHCPLNERTHNLISAEQL
jgi:glycerate dehydrogenase